MEKNTFIFPVYLLSILLIISSLGCKKSGDPQDVTSAKVVPTAINAVKVSSTGFTALWNTIAGADRYLLFIAKDSQFSQMLGAYNPKIVMDTSVVISNLSPGTKYFYLVQSTIKNVISSVSNTIQVTTVNLQWRVFTFAGAALTSGFADGQGAAARFNSPNCIAVDATDNIYVGDNRRIRKITPAGFVSTYAGNGQVSLTDGAALSAGLEASGITTDRSNNLYFTDRNCIRKVSTGGMISTIAGNSAYAGLTDGQGIFARLHGPGSIIADAFGNLYFYQQGNNSGLSDAVRKMSSSGYVSTIKQALNIVPAARAIAYLDNNLYITAGWSFKILKISLTGSVSNFTGITTSSGSYLDGDIALAKFGYMKGMCIDNNGSFFISDEGNSLIRKITMGNVSTLAGIYGNHGYADGPALSAMFPNMSSIAADSHGNIYVLDGHCIRKISYQ